MYGDFSTFGFISLFVALMEIANKRHFYPLFSHSTSLFTLCAALSYNNLMYYVIGISFKLTYD